MSRPYSHLSGAEVVELLDADDRQAADEATHRKSRPVQVALVAYLGRQGSRPRPSPPGASLPQLYEPAYERFNFANGTGRKKLKTLHYPPPQAARSPGQPCVTTSRPASPPRGPERPPFSAGYRVMLCALCMCPKDSSGCGCPD
jgi:hypothetical protein